MGHPAPTAAIRIAKLVFLILLSSVILIGDQIGGFGIVEQLR